jgi:hypothetical protein
LLRFFFSWAWVKERKKNKLLCDLRRHASLCPVEGRPIKVYVNNPVRFLEEILEALQIETGWSGTSQSSGKRQADYLKIQKINPFPLFLYLTNHPIESVYFGEILNEAGQMKLQCQLFERKNSSKNTGSELERRDMEGQLAALKDTFGPDILFIHSF